MLQNYVVRTQNAGVFFGEIKERNGSEVTMTNVRRLWKWAGATECIGLATHGTTKPQECKFTVCVDELIIFGVIEIIPCTDESVKSLSEVKGWKV